MSSDAEKNAPSTHANAAKKQTGIRMWVFQTARKTSVMKHVLFFFLRLRGRPESMRPVSLSGIPESLRPIRLKVSGFFFVSLSGKKTKEEKKG